MLSELVLDAGAFYAGTPFMSSSHSLLYTTSEIIGEVRHIKASISALEALQEVGRLAVRDADKTYVARVLKAAQNTGDRNALSDADISIISLALQLGHTLVTDDFSVANLASALGINVRPATAGKDIKQVRKWIYYCAGCSRIFSAGGECPLCGNALRRKYRKVRSA